jgi:hypothetical protein
MVAIEPGFCAGAGLELCPPSTGAEWKYILELTIYNSLMFVQHGTKAEQSE